jgi:hypothetical protein
LFGLDSYSCIAGGRWIGVEDRSSYGKEKVKGKKEEERRRRSRGSAVVGGRTRS